MSRDQNNRDSLAQRHELFEHQQKDVEDVIIAGTYLVEERIGEGSFGEVFRVVNKRTHVLYAIKREPANLTHPQLEHESEMYRVLTSSPPRPHPGIPNCHYFGEHEKYYVMVIDLLGPSLKQLRQVCDDEFPLTLAIDIGVQALSILEAVHSRGIVYRDVKPENFLLSTDFPLPMMEMVNVDVEQRITKIAPSSPLPTRLGRYQLSIVDFGLATWYCDPETGQHLPQSRTRTKHKTGTARYASLNVHRGKDHTRRDDIESLGYLLIDLIKGTLPWSGIQARNSKTGWEKMRHMKEDIPLEKLCKDLPRGIFWFLERARYLRFEETPNYKSLEYALRSCVLKGEGSQLVEWTGDFEEEVEDAEAERRFQGNERGIAGGRGKGRKEQFGPHKNGGMKEFDAMFGNNKNNGKTAGMVSPISSPVASPLSSPVTSPNLQPKGSNHSRQRSGSPGGSGWPHRRRHNNNNNTNNNTNNINNHHSYQHPATSSNRSVATPSPDSRWVDDGQFANASGGAAWAVPMRKEARQLMHSPATSDSNYNRAVPDDDGWGRSPSAGPVRWGEESPITDSGLPPTPPKDDNSWLTQPSWRDPANVNSNTYQKRQQKGHKMEGQNQNQRSWPAPEAMTPVSNNSARPSSPTKAQIYTPPHQRHRGRDPENSNWPTNNSKSNDTNSTPFGAPDRNMSPLQHEVTRDFSPPPNPAHNRPTSESNRKRGEGGGSGGRNYYDSRKEILSPTANPSISRPNGRPNRFSMATSTSSTTVAQTFPPPRTSNSVGPRRNQSPQSSLPHPGRSYQQHHPQNYRASFGPSLPPTIPVAHYSYQPFGFYEGQPGPEEGWRRSNSYHTKNGGGKNGGGNGYGKGDSLRNRGTSGVKGNGRVGGKDNSLSVVTK